MCPKKGKIELNILIPALVLIVGSAMLVWIVWEAHVANRESVYTKVELNAVSYPNRMIADIERSVAITDTLEQIVISENGRVDSFGTIAENMFEDFVQIIQPAPGGVATEIYPTEGNETGKIGLFGDGYRAEFQRYAKEHNETVMQGPFTLRQGGRGIAVRNPVFLDDSTGETVFRGFTVVIIRVPKLFGTSVQMLGQFGYDYRLSRTELPISTEYVPVYCTISGLVKPVVHELGLLHRRDNSFCKRRDGSPRRQPRP